MTNTVPVHGRAQTASMRVAGEVGVSEPMVSFKRNVRTSSSLDHVRLHRIRRRRVHRGELRRWPEASGRKWPMAPQLWSLRLAPYDGLPCRFSSFPNPWGNDLNVAG
jgi:hypothetical protein